MNNRFYIFSNDINCIKKNLTKNFRFNRREGCYLDIEAAY